MTRESYYEDQIRSILTELAHDTSLTKKQKIDGLNFIAQAALQKQIEVTNKVEQQK